MMKSKHGAKVDNDNEYPKNSLKKLKRLTHYAEKQWSPCNIIPTEIFGLIFEYLYYTEVLSISLVCKSFRDAANFDYLWKSIYLITYPTVFGKDGDPWRQLFICRKIMEKRQLYDDLPNELAEQFIFMDSALQMSREQELKYDTSLNNNCIALRRNNSSPFSSYIKKNNVLSRDIDSIFDEITENYKFKIEESPSLTSDTFQGNLDSPNSIKSPLSNQVSNYSFDLSQNDLDFNDENLDFRIDEGTCWSLISKGSHEISKSDKKIDLSHISNSRSIFSLENIKCDQNYCKDDFLLIENCLLDWRSKNQSFFSSIKALSETKKMSSTHNCSGMFCSFTYYNSINLYICNLTGKLHICCSKRCNKAYSSETDIGYFVCPITGRVFEVFPFLDSNEEDFEEYLQEQIFNCDLNVDINAKKVQKNSDRLYEAWLKKVKKPGIFPKSYKRHKIKNFLHSEPHENMNTLIADMCKNEVDHELLNRDNYDDFW